MAVELVESMPGWRIHAFNVGKIRNMKMKLDLRSS
jgi:hypothetical protein